MSKTTFNNGKPFHGSDAVTGGKLTGRTDTDYFYWLCPKCGDGTILRILDFTLTRDEPASFAIELRPKPRRDFIIAFELQCEQCGLHDFVKVSNIGWQGGKIGDVLEMVGD
jgi:phage terminase large subunit GpA-like protein